MKVLGANLGSNLDGKQLKDGGACVILDGKIEVAIAEERLSRIKNDGGFARSVPYCLDYLDLSLHDLDAIVISSCLDPMRYDKHAWGFNELDQNKIHYVSHHLSHAYSSFLVSSFEEAIIIVIDSGGNFLENCNEVSDEWWKYKREQNSYYIARGNKVTLIGRDFHEPYAVGFGEMYRAFTHYLGWHSYIHSGKTMALSIFGDSKRFEGVELFEMREGQLISLMQNDPLNPVKMVQQFAKNTDVDFGTPRSSDEPLEDMHKDIAYFVQDRMERTLLEKITLLSHQTGIKKLCLAGGVALNCVVNAKILKSTPIEKLFVVPAAGDTGQCLGNALYGHSIILGQQQRPEGFSPFLGRVYTNYKKTVDKWLQSSGADWEYFEIDNYLQVVARLISEGYLVAWCCGRSEFGPRALGARSILADARYHSVRTRLMEAKEREDFMPFAPSILREHAHEYFNPPVESPYMLLTADAKSYKKNLIPGVLHAEKNSRLQTVSLEDNPAFYGLLQEYMNITGIPLVINTSFNKKGSPIVEAPLDALEMFRSMDIDILVLNNLIVKKKGIHKKIAKVIMEAERKTVYNPELRQVVYDLSSITINQLRHLLKSDFPDYQLIPKSNLTLFNEYVKLLKDGRKVTTIRYRFKALHHPDNLILALEDTGISGAKDGEAEYTCKVKVTQYMVKPFGWLNTEDAKKDGFTSEEQLKIALQQIYGPIQPVEYVSIYTVELV